MGDFRFGYVMNYVLKYEELRPDANGGKRVALSEGQFEQPELRRRQGQ